MAQNKQPRSWPQQLTSFFTAMFNRMVGRAMSNNSSGAGHIGSSQFDSAYGGTPAIGDNRGGSPGAGQPGNMGGGAIPIGNIAVYPDPNSISFIKQGFSGNSTVFTIVNNISRKFAYLPRYVYEVKDPTMVRTYKHYLKNFDNKKAGDIAKLKDIFGKAFQTTVVNSGGAARMSALLERPNNYEGQDQFFQKLGSYYLTLGEAIVWCNRGTDDEDLPKIEGDILEMYILPPQYMEMVPDPFNVWGSLGWIFNVAGKRIPIDNENIIHIKTPQLDFDGVTRIHQRGLSVLRPGAKKLTEDESAQDASVALNQNQGAKGIAYDQSTVMNPAKETAVRGVIDRKVNNRDAAGSVAYIQGQLGYIDVAQTSQEMELEERKDNIFDRMCNMWGISPDLFKTGQTYQNLVQARKDLMTNVVIPMACTVNDEFKRVLLPAFGLYPVKYTIDIDVNMIIELQDDMVEQVNALVAAWWLTPNERRKEMHQAESDEEGMDDIWIQNTLVRMEDAAQPMDTVDSFNDTYPSGSGTSGNTEDSDQADNEPPAPGAKPAAGKESKPKTGKNAQAGGKDKGKN